MSIIMSIQKLLTDSLSKVPDPKVLRPNFDIQSVKSINCKSHSFLVITNLWQS